MKQTTTLQTNALPRYSIGRLTISAVFMALVVVLSSFSIPVPGGHLYFCDTMICTASILLADPFLAFVTGGFGSFLGDVFFYPAPMFVSLFSHGLQALVIAWCTRHLFRKKPALASAVGVTLGAVIMVTGYTIGRAFVYATPETALIKLPFEIFQAGFGAVFSMLLCYPGGLLKVFRRFTRYGE